MLRVALFFFILSLLSFMAGAIGLAGISIEIGKSLLFVFALLSLLSGLVGLVANGRGVPRV